MLEDDIALNLQLELFGTSVVFDEKESGRRISEAIVKIEDCLPRVRGEDASLESAITLQTELRNLLSEIAAADLKKIHAQIRLRKKVQAAGGSLSLQREAIIFPDGDIFFKSWLYENEDAALLAFFKAAQLFDELCRPRRLKDLPLVLKSGGPRLALRIYEEAIAMRTHHPNRAEGKSGSPSLKLSLCVCGCGGLFLQSGERAKNFINDRHRMNYHNILRTSTGENRKAVRAYRAKHKKR